MFPDYLSGLLIWVQARCPRSQAHLRSVFQPQLLNSALTFLKIWAIRPANRLGSFFQTRNLGYPPRKPAGDGKWPGPGFGPFLGVFGPDFREKVAQGSRNDRRCMGPKILVWLEVAESRST